MTAAALRWAGRHHRGARSAAPLLVAFAAAALAAGLGRAVLTTYLPVLLERLEDSPGLIGTALLVNAVAGVTVPLAVGVLSDRRRAGGRRRAPVFVLGGATVAAFGLMGVALGSATSFLGLTAFAAVVYVGLNAVTTVHRAMIPESFPEAERSGATGAQEVGALLGSVVGVGAGGALLQVSAWAPFATAAVALPLLAIPTVRAMRGRETFTTAPAGQERPRLSDLVREAARPGVRSLLAAQALWVLGYAALPAFFILYAEHVLGAEPGLAGLWLVLFGALTGATMALAGRAREPRHHRRLVAAGVVLLGGGLLAAGAASSVPATAPGLAAAAVGFGLVTTIGFPLYSALIPPSETGRYTALYFSVRSVAGAIALPAAGWTVAATGSYRSILIVGGLVTLLALGPLGVGPGLPAWYRRAGTAWLGRWTAALGALAAVTLGVGLLVAETPLARIDAALFRVVNGLDHGPEALWTWLNPHTRNYVALIVLTIVLASLVDRRRAVGITGFVALSWLVGVGLQQTMHLIWDRPRPEEVLGAGEAVLDGHVWAHLASFPSGHAVATAALVAAMARAFPAARPALWPYLAAVAVSRVLFGAHFPSDVIIGLAFGYAAARAVEALLRRTGLLELAPPRPRRDARGVRRRARLRTAPAASHPRPAPSAAPTAMSSQKCTPRYTRDNAMTHASARRGRRIRGQNIPIATAVAKAMAACEDGNEGEAGVATSASIDGCATAGRRRSTRSLSSAAASDAIPSASPPAAAATGRRLARKSEITPTPRIAKPFTHHADTRMKGGVRGAQRKSCISSDASQSSQSTASTTASTVRR